jgi:hypothetical protein
MRLEHGKHRGQYLINVIDHDPAYADFLLTRRSNEFPKIDVIREYLYDQIGHFVRIPRGRYRGCLLHYVKMRDPKYYYRFLEANPEYCDLI